VPKYFVGSASTDSQEIVLQGCILFNAHGDAVALLGRFSIIVLAKYTVQLLWQCYLVAKLGLRSVAVAKLAVMSLLQSKKSLC
jgi:hypothetical protein